MSKKTNNSEEFNPYREFAVVLEGVRSDNKIIIEDLTSVKSKLNATVNMVGKNTEGINRLEFRLDGLKVDFKELKSELGNVKGAVDKLDTRLARVEGGVSELKSDFGAVKADVAELKVDLSKVKSDVGVIKADFGNRLTGIEETLR